MKKETAQVQLVKNQEPQIKNTGAYITISKSIKYSPDGYNVLTLEAGKYEAKDLHPVILKLHKEGVV